ncbi:helix-turn-helix domain-containing protein [Lactococcus petauri]|uniref:helix-turn-helix domain-containing protein n=1 Tax=Lactococcus petauri TaxID=1940789 RepID=UPI0022DF8526|nr:helix-turn-helix domain-containing protein [Lactococcus petauri]
MNIEALLEKKEQIQVKILRQLVLKRDKITAQELCEGVNLSRPSIESYLEDISYLGQMMGKPMEVMRQDNKLALNMAESQSLDEVISFLIQDSIKYRMLLLLFEQKNYMFFELAEALLVSESTLFRKIKELNKLLSEFELQIKNNKLLGEESQIRYFYYLLFDSLHPKFRPNFLQVTKFQVDFILQLEETLKVTFSESSQDKLYRWLAITEKRRKLTDIQVTQSLEMKKIYQDDHLYQLLDSLFYQYIYDKQSKNNCETIFFYSFLLSFFILDKESYYRFDIFRSKKIPTVLLNISLRERMLNHYRPHRLGFEEEKAISYQLAQVNNKFAFFHGSLFTKSQEALLSHKQNWVDKSFQDLLDNLKEIALSYIPKTQDLPELIFGYRNALMLLELLSAQQLTVAYDLSDTPAYQIPMEHYLKNRLRAVEKIKLEHYHEGQSYDLLISSKRNDSRKFVYVLSEFSSEYDFEELLTCIEALKKEKFQKKAILN